MHPTSVDGSIGCILMNGIGDRAVVQVWSLRLLAGVVETDCDRCSKAHLVLMSRRYCIHNEGTVDPSADGR